MELPADIAMGGEVTLSDCEHCHYLTCAVMATLVCHHPARCLSQGGTGHSTVSSSLAGQEQQPLCYCRL